jgi:hypothetical protein
MRNFFRDEARHEWLSVFCRRMISNQQQDISGFCYRQQTGSNSQPDTHRNSECPKGPPRYKRLGFIVAQSLDPQDYANPSFPSTCLQFYLALTHVKQVSAMSASRISAALMKSKTMDNQDWSKPRYKNNAIGPNSSNSSQASCCKKETMLPS